MNRHSPLAIKAFKELQSHRLRSLEVLIERARHTKQQDNKVTTG
jgi:hypothetical protein